MRNKKYYIGIAVWALLSACSSEHTEEILTGGKGEKIAIRALTREADEKGIPFEEGKKIAVYNAEYPENESAPQKRGIYQKIGNVWVNEPEEDACGLWNEEMESYSGTSYCFTAVSYLNGQALQGDGTHSVLQDQTNIPNFEKSDFLVARALYDDKNSWTGENAISLLFHHVLSRLDIVVYLPIGNSNDGAFNANVAQKPISMTLIDPVLNYQILYDKSILKDKELAQVQKDTKNGDKKANITMFSPIKGETDDTILVPGTSTKAIKYRCQAILPRHQYFSSSTKCLTIKIDGKTYSYTPESDKIMTFTQEKITTVYLVLYSQKGNTQVVLNSVKITPWKTDKTNIGDLIEQ